MISLHCFFLVGLGYVHIKLNNIDKLTNKDERKWKWLPSPLVVCLWICVDEWAANANELGYDICSHFM